MSNYEQSSCGVGTPQTTSPVKSSAASISQKTEGLLRLTADILEKISGPIPEKTDEQNPRRMGLLGFLDTTEEQLSIVIDRLMRISDTL